MLVPHTIWACPGPGPCWTTRVTSTATRSSVWGVDPDESLVGCDMTPLPSVAEATLALAPRDGQPAKSTPWCMS